MGHGDGFGPEDEARVRATLVRAAAAFRGASAGGLAWTALRHLGRRAAPRPRVRRFPILATGVGGLVAVLSLATCSPGVDIASLTARYGEPVPATLDEARAFVEKMAVAAQGAVGARRVALSVSEAEATSALSLGLMLPELMRAMESMPAEEVQGAASIEDLRERIRRRQEEAHARLGFWQKVGEALDPHLRTGDVQVRFTREGQVVLAGYVQAWRWQQPALVVMAPSAGAGAMSLDFVQGRLGRVPAPEWAFDLLGRTVASLLLAGEDWVSVSELAVEEDRMTFVAETSR